MSLTRKEKTMSRMFETSEITKLLDVLIGNVEAIGETEYAVVRSMRGEPDE